MGRRAFRRNDVIDQQSRSQTEPIPAATRKFHLDNATSGATFTRTVQPSPGQDTIIITTRSSGPRFEPTNHHTPLALRSRFGNDCRASVGFDARRVSSVTPIAALG